jgi:fructose/tagatose bisphosphate aldolase
MYTKEELHDPTKLDTEMLAETIIMTEDNELKRLCCWAAHELARKQGIIPSSIHELYMAMGREEIAGFTVPAMNLRTLTYETARTIFASAKKIDAGALIFEIARSEMGYTEQPPMEYASMVLLAAVAEGHKGAIFIQGDHFQIKAAKFKEDRQGTVDDLKRFIDESINAGFYNIDIDSSTLVDLSKETLEEQQRYNFEVCAELTNYIREKEPEGVTISAGGEIGEVGKENSKPEEMHAFLKGYLPLVKGIGLSKMSINTGSSHGGVVLPDGSIAKVQIDFETLKVMSKLARETYKMSGCVQHGASTLPDEAFNQFPKHQASEIHLATGFQNIVFDHLPEDLVARIYAWLDEHCANERKEGQTDDQFHYKLRKKAMGPFKRELFQLPKETKEKIMTALGEKFDFLFEQLNIKGTQEHVDKYITLVEVIQEKEQVLAGKQQENDGSGDD